MCHEPIEGICVKINMILLTSNINVSKIRIRKTATTLPLGKEPLVPIGKKVRWAPDPVSMM
jgi:hypothetical protein